MGMPGCWAWAKHANPEIVALAKTKLSNEFECIHHSSRSMTPKAEGRVQGYLQSELVNGYKTSGQTVLAPDALGAYDMVTVSDGYPPYREFGGRRRAGRVAPHS